MEMKEIHPKLPTAPPEDQEQGYRLQNSSVSRKGSSD